MFKLGAHKEKIAIIDDNGNKVSYEMLSNHCLKFKKMINERYLIFILCTNSTGA